MQRIWRKKAFWIWFGLSVGVNWLIEVQGIGNLNQNPLGLWFCDFCYLERDQWHYKNRDYSPIVSIWCLRIWVNFRMFNNILYSLYWIFSVLEFSEMSLFLTWTILLNYFLSNFFVVSLRFMCLVFVQDIEEPFFFLIVALLGTMFGT